MIDDYWRKLAEAQQTSEHNATAKQQRAAADKAGQLAYARTQTKLEVSKFLAVMKRAGNPGMIRLLVDDDYDKVMTIVKDFKGYHEHALGLKEYFLTSRAKAKTIRRAVPGWACHTSTAYWVNGVGGGFTLGVLLNGQIGTVEPKDIALTRYDSVSGHRSFRTMFPSFYEDWDRGRIVGPLVHIIRKSGVAL